MDRAHALNAFSDVSRADSRFGEFAENALREEMTERIDMAHQSRLLVYVAAIISSRG
jgi:hypothetical protein